MNSKTILWIYFFLSGSSLAANLYTLKDLEILESQKNYQEFFLHARDVRPVERSGHWQQMVRHMGISWIDFELKKNTFETDVYEKLILVAEWPVLREDGFFRQKLSIYVLGYFRKCFARSGEKKQRELYLAKIRRYSGTFDRDPEVGSAIAKLILKYNPGVNVWNYLSKVVASSKGKEYCGREFVQKEVLQEFNRRFKLEQNLKKVGRQIDDLIHPLCWKQIKTGFKKMLFTKISPKNGPIEDILFKVLSAKKGLSEEEKDYYLTLFILNGPLIGETFNQAWFRLKKLGQDFYRRQKVIKQLVQIDPLPDGIVGIVDQSKRETLLNFVSFHLPEYFKHYAQTCLNYLQGKGIFPNGNPTVRCREFFRYSKGKKMVSDKIHRHYSAVTKIEKK